MVFKLKISHQFIIVWLSLAAFLHNILMNGANNVIISSLQKEFYLSSRETGIYVSVYDIGSLISSIAISFAAARGSKPKWISFGMIMLFIGSMIVVLPHFLKPNEYKSERNGKNLGSTSLSFVSSDNSIEMCNYSMSIDSLGNITYFPRKTREVSYNKNADDVIKNKINTDNNKNNNQILNTFRFKFQPKYLLYIGNMINGLSSASMTTITFSYIEDIAPHKLSSIYESVYFAVGAFGVGVGFLITSRCLRYHTDLDRMGKLPSWLNTSHPNWIGAWWLPFLIFGVVSFLLALGILLFPQRVQVEETKRKQNSNDRKKLKPINELKDIKRNKSNGNSVQTEVESIDNETDNEFQDRNYEHNRIIDTIMEAGSLLSLNNLGQESHNQIKHKNGHIDPHSTSSSDSIKSKKKLSLIDKSILLIKNPVYLFVIITAAIEGLLQNSFLAFASLFLEYQYRLASGSASLILGLLSIPPLIFGGLLGGFIVNRFENKTKKCFQFLSVVLFINIIVYAGFMTYCKEPNIIALNNKHNLYSNDYKLAEECNCNEKLFKPVCLKNSNDIVYQTSCLAGCLSYDKDTEFYFNCTQAENTYKNQNGSNNYFINGLCPKDSSCTFRLVISYMCIFLLMFMNALTFLPYLKATFGCIGAQEMNSIGLGIKQFFMNAFGTIPGPILFGYIIDSTCIYWHNDLNNQSVCKMYNNRKFAFVFGLLGIGFKTVCFLLIVLSLFVLRKKSNNTQR